VVLRRRVVCPKKSVCSATSTREAQQAVCRQAVSGGGEGWASGKQMMNPQQMLRSGGRSQQQALARRRWRDIPDKRRRAAPWQKAQSSGVLAGARVAGVGRRRK